MSGHGRWPAFSVEDPVLDRAVALIGRRRVVPAIGRSRWTAGASVGGSTLALDCDRGVGGERSRRSPARVVLVVDRVLAGQPLAISLRSAIALLVVRAALLGAVLPQWSTKGPWPGSWFPAPFGPRGRSADSMRAVVSWPLRIKQRNGRGASGRRTTSRRPPAAAVATSLAAPASRGVVVLSATARRCRGRRPCPGVERLADRELVRGERVAGRRAFGDRVPEWPWEYAWRVAPCCCAFARAACPPN